MRYRTAVAAPITDRDEFLNLSNMLLCNIFQHRSDVGSRIRM